MTRAAVKVPTQRKPRARKEVVEPEKSDAAAAKQAREALAKLNAAEIARVPGSRAARAQRAREAGNKRAAEARERAEADLREKALARRDGKAKSPVRDSGPVHHPAPEVKTFDLHSAIQALEPEFIQCRDWGHSWRPFHAQWMPRMNHYESILRCARCETERVRYIGSRGQILDNKYGYADGYQMPKGAGRMSTTDRDMVRLASMRIIETKDTVQE